MELDSFMYIHVHVHDVRTCRPCPLYMYMYNTYSVHVHVHVKLDIKFMNIHNCICLLLSNQNSETTSGIIIYTLYKCPLSVLALCASTCVYLHVAFSSALGGSKYMYMYVY